MVVQRYLNGFAPVFCVGVVGFCVFAIVIVGLCYAGRWYIVHSPFLGLIVVLKDVLDSFSRHWLRASCGKVCDPSGFRLGYNFICCMFLQQAMV